MFTLFILLVTMSVALFRYCLRRTHTYECKNKHTQHDDTASRQMQVSWVALTTRYLLVPSVSVNRSSTRWLLQYCNLPATTHAVWPRHDRQRTRLKRKHAPLSVCVCVVQPRVSNMQVALCRSRHHPNPNRAARTPRFQLYSQVPLRSNYPEDIDGRPVTRLLACTQIGIINAS